MYFGVSLPVGTQDDIAYESWKGYKIIVVAATFMNMNG